MWTITSAMSGRSRRIRSSISLARACASSSAARAVEPERQERDQPVVRAQEAQLARLAAGLLARRPARRAPRRRPRPRAPRVASASGSRCVCTPAISGTAARIARSSSSAIACASSRGRSPGSFRCSESSVRPSTSTERRGCAPPAPAARRRAACVHALAQRRVLLIGSTCTTTSAFGSARVDRRLDGVGSRVSLADRRAR